jgi:muconate cycloisomerase
MIAVDRIETFLLQIPEREDFRWFSLTSPLGAFVVARVEAAGQVGWGEVVALRDWGTIDGRRHGETPSTVAAIVHEQLAPWLFTHEVGIGEVSNRFDELVVGHPYAKALIEMALFDLMGHVLGVPVYELLGGASRSKVPVAHMIGILPEDRALAEGRGAVDEGVRALQVKGGRDPKRDVELIGQLRRELGDEIHLRLDANGGYKSRAVAGPTLAALAGAGANMVEQPVLDLAEIADLRRQSPLPLMVDESCWTPSDALDVVRVRGADALSVYVGKAGGLGRARAVCSIAAAAGLPHDLNGGLELGIGNAANLHLAIASPATLLPSVIPVNGPAGAAPTMIAGHYSEDDIVKSSFKFEDGQLLASDAPGLGVEVDLEKVARYRMAGRVSDRSGTA